MIHIRILGYIQFDLQSLQYQDKKFINKVISPFDQLEKSHLESSKEE